MGRTTWLAIPIGALILASCTAGAAETSEEHVRSQEPVVATLAAAASATPTSEPPSPTAQPTPQATGATTAVPTAAAGVPTVLTGQLGLGKKVYETVAGTGCTECHGPAGKGGRTEAGDSAPDIRGATETKVRAALNGGAAVMSYLELTDDEIEAVVAFLKYLNEQ